MVSSFINKLKVLNLAQVTIVNAKQDKNWCPEATTKDRNVLEM